MLAGMMIIFIFRADSLIDYEKSDSRVKVKGKARKDFKKNIKHGYYLEKRSEKWNS